MLKKPIKKIFYLSFYTVVLFASMLQATESSVESFLFLLKNNSPDLKILNDQIKASLIEANKEHLIFRTTGFLKSSYSYQDSPPTSPFSLSNSSVLNYEVGDRKLWKTGIDSQITYSLSDNSSSFFSGNEISFLNPKLELSLSTNIFQNIFYDSYGYLNEEIINTIQTTEMNQKVMQKKILAQGLLDFLSLLEQEEELGLQKDLCQKSRKQAQQLSLKRKRNSISKRVYFLSLRESSLCQAKIKELEKIIFENQNKFESKYNVTIKSYKILNSEKILNELKTYYEIFSKNNLKNIKDNDEISYLKSVLKLSQSTDAKLKALAKTNLSIEVKAGATGLNDRFFNAHNDVGDLKYPFIYIGAQLDIPFKNRDAIENLKANIYKSKAIEGEMVLLQDQFIKRMQILNQTLKNDFLIYKKYLKSFEYSQIILSEARKDFNNGRIDFYDLTEFNKSLIEDKKILSSYRLSLLVRMVEFLDFHHYFDRYL